MAETAETAETTRRDEFEETASQIKDRIESTVDYFREHGVQDVVDDLTRYVKSHPTQALIGAAMLGFVAGQLIRRR
ncbi:MAG TPA: hypothetical protein VES67_07070 [Vicinamibacterales bacterium]|nr:hypothetical protein [Vicinamibacterales bacterium]